MEILNYFRQMFWLAAEGHTQGIWFWASVYAFVVCSCSARFQIRTRNWPSTKGKLAHLGIKKFGATEGATSNPEYFGKALYTYLVSGIQYEGSRLSPWIFVVSYNARFVLEKQRAGIQTYPDGGVKVYYNPGNPNKSYLIVAGKTGIVVTVLLSTLPFVCYWIKYYA